MAQSHKETVPEIEKEAGQMKERKAREEALVRAKVDSALIPVGTQRHRHSLLK